MPGSGRSPGGALGNPLQDYCLESPMDRGAWQAAVHRVAKSRTLPSGNIKLNVHLSYASNKNCKKCQNMPNAK